MKNLSGSCLCGKIKFQVPDDFEYMGNCHCSECRKFSGSDYASVGGISTSRFQITEGEDAITYFRKSEETDLAFCETCGSSLFTRKRAAQKHNIRLGVLDNTPTRKPAFHIFTGSKAPWITICDGLPQFEKGPSDK